jgi:hypothetical protein
MSHLTYTQPFSESQPNHPLQRTGGQRCCAAQRPSHSLEVVLPPPLSVRRSLAGWKVIAYANEHGCPSAHQAHGPRQVKKSPRTSRRVLKPGERLCPGQQALRTRNKARHDRESGCKTWRRQPAGGVGEPRISEDASGLGRKSSPRPGQRTRRCTGRLTAPVSLRVRCLRCKRNRILSHITQGVRSTRTVALPFCGIIEP